MTVRERIGVSVRAKGQGQGQGKAYGQGYRVGRRAKLGLGRGLSQLGARGGTAGKIRGEDGGHERLEAVEARRLQHEQPHLRRNTGLGLRWRRDWVEVGRGVRGLRVRLGRGL